MIHSGSGVLCSLGLFVALALASNMAWIGSGETVVPFADTRVVVALLPLPSLLLSAIVLYCEADETQ